jgi:hypothetical protein
LILGQLIRVFGHIYYLIDNPKLFEHPLYLFTSGATRCCQ